MAIIDLTTAALIFAQFWVLRWTWLLVLACGFFFTGLIAIPYGLTFPEAFAPSGLLGAGAQTAAWLSICSRLASPIALIIAILARQAWGTAGIGQRSPGMTILLSISLVIAVVSGLTWAIVATDQVLPGIHVNGLQHNLDLLLPIIALTIVPLVMLWMWGRSVLDLWLMVMCCAWVFDLSLVILADARYTAGWYTARSFQVAAVFFVLMLFLYETTALYANLARASVLKRGAYHARQIAMDIMAASLAHEIKQPLTAVLVNADAGIQKVAGQPELEGVRTIFSDIAADGRRINEIIAGVRTMFTGSAHERRPLDINNLVRNTLATVELELQQQNISVEMEFDENLPPVLADSGQLHQVFLNLITNALEATAAVPDRPSVLRLTSVVLPGSRDIAVTVEDTGIGIPEKVRDRMPEPFFSTKAAGIGVGLTICNAIIKGHGGSLHISANHPHGTVVRVTLPYGGDE